MTDDELLAAFVAHQDGNAFREVVERYTPLVYLAARRQVRDPHVAEDITQAVFMLLARKAGSVRSGAVLAGWLINATRLTARAAIRSDVRRKRRERSAAMMNPASTSVEPSDAEWVRDFIDDALCRLRAKDRTAVTLRYLHGKSPREVAEIMRISEDAAARRISRAMAKLRAAFAKNGCPIAPAAFGETIFRETFVKSPPTPAHLAQAATDAALRPATLPAGAAPTAFRLMQAVLSSLRWRLAATVVTAAFTILVLGSISLAILLREPVLPVIAPLPPASPAVIRVGVYLSAKTGLNALPIVDGWNSQVRIVGEFGNDSSIELLPIIEPGTAEIPEEKQLLATWFPGKPVVNVMDPASLRQVDVIVASSVHEPPLEALQSIEDAVTAGTGLYLRRCLGSCKIGVENPRVAALTGLERIPTDPLASIGVPIECAVVGSHPMLGSLSGQTSFTFRHPLAGTWGALPAGRGIPLIRMKTTDKLRYRDKAHVPRKPDSLGDVLYLSALGKGRIVGCAFWDQTPPELMQATRNRFSILAVQWLANRPVR